jgi:hypothetical protein
MKILINTAILVFVCIFSATAARSQLVPINCSGSTASGTLSCGSGSGFQYQTNLITTGRVQFTPSNVFYNPGTGQFTFNATIQNLENQPLGTTDGVTIAPSGIRVFFHSGPTVTGDTGLASVIPDGFGTFTAAGQPYYQYQQILAQFQTSSARIFTLIMPPTVASFSFQILVSAPVEFAPPTAASVSVTGRVLSADGNGVTRAIVTIIGSNGDIKSVRTNSFGYFCFNEVEAGQTYIFNVSAKGYSFAPQVVSVSDDITELNFTAIE